MKPGEQPGTRASVAEGGQPAVPSVFPAAARAARAYGQNAQPPALPRCSLKQLTQSLQSRGLTGSKTVRITYDQQFPGPADPSWRVIGEDPKIDSYFSMATCAQTK